jgi:hypothetical protein
VTGNSAKNVKEVELAWCTSTFISIISTGGM